MIRQCSVTEKDLPKTYLKLLNGVLGLTDSELELTAVIISKYRKYGMDGLAEPYLSKFVFSTEERKVICEDLEISNQSFGNKLKQLIDKGVLIQDGQGHQLNSELLPVPEVTFRFYLKPDDE